MLQIDFGKLTPYLIAISILCLNPIWPLWGGIGTAISYCCVLILLLSRYKSVLVILFKPKIYILFSCLIYCFVIHSLFVGFHTSNVIITLTFLLALTLDEHEKILSLRYLTRVLALIILVSLPAWLIHVFVYEFPSFGEIDNSEFKGAVYPMNNYILFVTMATANTFRFYSMFDEPGVLGTLSAFVLFGNAYNFKDKYNVIILIGTFFTFSLAFYILTIIGYLVYSFKSIKRFLVSIFFLILIPFIAYLALEDNLAFQYSIVDRFSGSAMENLDNRTGSSASDYYSTYVYTSQALLGIGSEKMAALGLKEGQSYKLFVIEYGWFSILILVLFYWVLAGKLDFYTSMFCILFALSFLQRPFAFTVWQILLFSCVTSCCKDYPFKVLK